MGHQNATSQRTEDAVKLSETLSVLTDGVQDGTGAVLQPYTNQPTNLLLMLKKPVWLRKPSKRSSRKPKRSSRRPRKLKRSSRRLKKLPKRSPRNTQNKPRRSLKKPRKPLKRRLLQRRKSRRSLKRSSKRP